jgi:hypothetical protein
MNTAISNTTTQTTVTYLDLPPIGGHRRYFARFFLETEDRTVDTTVGEFRADAEALLDEGASAVDVYVELCWPFDYLQVARLTRCEVAA